MKPSLILLLCFLWIFISCKSNSSQCMTETVDIEALSKETFIDPSYTLRTPEQFSGYSKKKEYSHNTVIVMLVDGTVAEDINKLASDYQLNVVYNYTVINGCALSSDKELTEDVLSDLIEKLSSDRRVLSVEKDYIYTLSDDI